MVYWKGIAAVACVAFWIITAAEGRDAIQLSEELSLLRANLPGVRVQQYGLNIERVYGKTLSEGAAARASADAFIVNHTHVFGVEADELLLTGFDGTEALAQPVMLDKATGEPKFYLYRYVQQLDGIPVFRSDLRVLVRNIEGYPTVLASSSLKAIGEYTLGRMVMNVRYELAEAAAANIARTGFSGESIEKRAFVLTDFTEPQHVIWAGTDIATVPRLAVTYVGDNYDDPYADRPEKWLFVADAESGEILLAESEILFAEVTGNVSGKATTLPKSAPCNPEVVTAMSYALVGISGGNSTFADINGNFTITNGGSSTVTVESLMSGLYFTVDDVTGSEETLTLSVTPPGSANFVHNNANTSEFVRAQINGYVQANVVRNWALEQNPSYPVIATQTDFPVRVNRSDMYCPANAWYDGSALNFCRSSGIYPNTAFSSVLHHEYGHHLVGSGGSGQEAYGEGMSDCAAILIANDPVLGYGFHGDCNSGSRTADNNFQYPCTGEIHDCGQLLTGCVWSTREYLEATEPEDYLSIISELTVNSILLHSGEYITPSITVDFLTLDDDDADLENGTPHYDEILNGFGDHNMWPGSMPENDDCSGAERACPGTYSSETGGMTNDGSSSCGMSDLSPDVWYRYTPISDGTLSLALCDSDYDTVVSVHTSCPGTTENEIGCNNDTDWFGECGFYPTTQSYMEVAVTAGDTYYIRISGDEGDAGMFVLVLSGPDCVDEADLVPPSPDPMTFSTPPMVTSSNAVIMSATPATDADSPPVQYEFDFVSGGDGGSDSGWQSSTTYVDDGLSPNTEYTYRVRARDGAATPNITGYSGEFSTVTWANVPSAPTASDIQAHSFKLDVSTNGNPDSTTYSIKCRATSPADANWGGMYVDSDGAPSAAPVWQTDAQWGVLEIEGVEGCIEYRFVVKARNSNLVTTTSSAVTSVTTLHYGDVDGDGDVNLSDLATLLANYGATSGAVYGDGDLNCDGSVDLSDLAALLAVYGGSC